MNVMRDVRMVQSATPNLPAQPLSWAAGNGLSALAQWYPTNGLHFGDTRDIHGISDNRSFDGDLFSESKAIDSLATDTGVVEQIHTQPCAPLLIGEPGRRDKRKRPLQ